LACTAFACAAPWQHPLYLANGGHWPVRMAVTIENPTDTAVAGEPVGVPVDALAGQRAESLRVCDAAGVDGPVSTIQLEQVREGLEDYEALALLAELVEKAKQAGKPCDAGERALAMARDLVTIPNAGGLRSTEILPDPARIPAIRKAVNAALVGLLQ
jgi:hypothetical protein